MQIIITDSNVRVHSTPELVTTNVVGYVQKGDIFIALDINSSWYELNSAPYGGRYVHKSVSSVYVAPPPPQPLAYVPWRSQESSDSNGRTNDCGEACVAGLIQYMTGKYVTVDSLRVPNETGLSTAQDLVALLVKNGVPATWNFIPNNQYPLDNSICLVWYGGIDRKNVTHTIFTGWHWMTFLQVAWINGQQWVVAHDPYNPPTTWNGRNHLYSVEEWAAAHIPYPGDSGRTVVVLK